MCRKHSIVCFVLALLLSPELASVSEALQISDTRRRGENNSWQWPLAAGALALSAVLPVLTWLLVRHYAPQRLETVRKAAMVLLALLFVGLVGYCYAMLKPVVKTLKYTRQTPRSPRVDSFNGSRTLHLATLATKPARMFDILKESASNHSVKLDVLGWGQEWTGFMMKVDVMQAYLNGLEDNAIVCYLDGYDSILMSNETEIVEKFLASGYNGLFARDLVFNVPIVNNYVVNKLFLTDTDNAINAGMYMGFASTLRKLTDRIKATCDGGDDQRCINNQVAYLNELQIAVDYDAQVFANLGFVSYTVVDSRVVLAHGSKPCAVSCPSSNLEATIALLQQLNIEASDALKQEVRAEQWKKMSDFVGFFKVEALFCCAMFGVVVFLVLAYLAPGHRYKEIQKTRLHTAAAKAHAAKTAEPKDEPAPVGAVVNRVMG